MQNEPVLVNGLGTIIGAVLAPLLAKYGIDADGTAKIVAFLGAIVVAALSVLSVFRARSKVTPVVTPTPAPPVAVPPPPPVTPTAP